MIINELVENYIYFPNLLCQGYSLVPWLHSSSAPGVIGGDPVMNSKTCTLLVHKHVHTYRNVHVCAHEFF